MATARGQLIEASQTKGWWHAVLPSGRPVASPSAGRIQAEARKEKAGVLFIGVDGVARNVAGQPA